MRPQGGARPAAPPARPGRSASARPAASSRSPSRARPAAARPCGPAAKRSSASIGERWRSALRWASSSRPAGSAPPRRSTSIRRASSAMIHHAGRRSAPAATTGRVACTADRTESGDARVTSARSSWPGGGEHVGGEVAQLAVDHVDHREHVEAGQRVPHTVGFREGGDRVAAGDDERPQLASLDLVDQRDRRVLAGRRAGGRAGCAGPQRDGRAALRSGARVAAGRRDRRGTPCRPVGRGSPTARGPPSGATPRARRRAPSWCRSRTSSPPVRARRGRRRRGGARRPRRRPPRSRPARR